MPVTGKTSVRSKGFGMKPRGRRESVPLSAIRANPWNPNVQSPEIQKKTQASLNRFGVVAEILVREVGPDNPEGAGRREEVGLEIVDGEHRWQEMVEAGVPEVEVRNLGVITDSEAKQLTVVMNELKGTPDPVLMGELVADLASKGKMEEMNEVFPYSASELDGLARLADVDPYFLKTSSERMTDARRGEGIPFQVGRHKTQVPHALGVRLVKAYDRVARTIHTADPIAVWPTIAGIIQSMEVGDGEEGQDSAEG